MEQTESSIDQSKEVGAPSVLASQTPSMYTPSTERLTKAMLVPQSGSEPCPTCGGASASHTPPSYVYALGKIDWRFPKQSVEKEFAQATGRAETAGQTD